MFALGAATRIYVATGATDMRTGFDGLWGKIRDVLECDRKREKVPSGCRVVDRLMMSS